jgi:hypothetical protein
MELLSEDDPSPMGMTLAELEAAWDLWFDLAQHANDFDPPYTHGVFQGVAPDRADPVILGESETGSGAG